MSTPGEPKRALILREDAQGQSRVVGIVEGADAEAVIAKAQASGVEVRKDAQEVEQFLRPQAEESNVPQEVYDLMATIIGFAQELNEQWSRPQD